MTSIIKVDEIQNKAGSTTLDADKLPTAYNGSAKTFAFFNQQTLTIGGSLNISSSTDTATGSFTHNFSSAYAAYTDRAVVGTAMQSGVRNLVTSGPNDSATNSCRMNTVNTAGTYYDADRSGTVILGDLA